MMRLWLLGLNEHVEGTVADADWAPTPPSAAAMAAASAARFMVLLGEGWGGARMMRPERAAVTRAPPRLRTLGSARSEHARERAGAPRGDALERRGLTSGVQRSRPAICQGMPRWMNVGFSPWRW